MGPHWYSVTFNSLFSSNLLGKWDSHKMGEKGSRNLYVDVASHNLHATKPNDLWPLGTFLLYLPSHTQRWSSTLQLTVYSMLFTDLQMKGFVLTSYTKNCRLLLQHCVISWWLVPSKRQMWGYARWTYTPRKNHSETNNCKLLCKRSM